MNAEYVSVSTIAGDTARLTCEAQVLADVLADVFAPVFANVFATVLCVLAALVGIAARRLRSDVNVCSRTTAPGLYLTAWG